MTPFRLAGRQSPCDDGSDLCVSRLGFVSGRLVAPPVSGSRSSRLSNEVYEVTSIKVNAPRAKRTCKKVPLTNPQLCYWLVKSYLVYVNISGT